MNKKALFSSISILLVAAICLSVAVYAWFVVSPSELNDFSIKANAEGTLLISVDPNLAPTSWKTSIQLSDSSDPLEFLPVSTDGYCIDFFRNAADASGSYYRGASNYWEAEESDYFSEEIYFKFRELF